MKNYSNMNLSQGVILRKMIYYIKNFNLEENEKSEYIDLLKIGMCNGLSFLYSIYKLAGKEQCFFHYLRIIADYNEGSLSISKEDKIIFESIIGQLIFVQSRGEMVGIEEFLHRNYK